MSESFVLEVVLPNGKTRRYDAQSYSSENGELEITKSGDTQKLITFAAGQWSSVEEL